MICNPGECASYGDAVESKVLSHCVKSVNGMLSTEFKIVLIAENNRSNRKLISSLQVATTVTTPVKAVWRIRRR